MANANYTVTNKTNRTVEVDGVVWLPGQARNLIFVTSSVSASGLLDVVKNNADDDAIALDTTTAVLNNNSVQAPFNSKDL